MTKDPGTPDPNTPGPNTPGPSTPPRFDHEFVPQPTPPQQPTGVSPYLPGLPTPQPLSAEQFMPVLPPEALWGHLSETGRELTLIDNEAQRSELRRRERSLGLRLEEYSLHYAATQAALTRTLAETGAGVRDSWLRQEEHLSRRHDIMSSSEKAYLEATGALNAAEKERFEALSGLGLRPDTHNAADLYTQLAIQQMAAEGVPYRPKERRSLSAQVFGLFATFSKFFVGLLSGVSINLLFNPDNRLYMTIIALTAGIMLSVLLLWLVEELAYRARVSKLGGQRWVNIGFIVVVAALYMSVEGFLNWDGILRVTQQIAADAASSGTLTDLSSDTVTAAPPQHWSLLAFTVVLVSMAVGAAIIQGISRAGLLLERERLETYMARLKTDPQLQQAARAAEYPALLQEARSRVQPPREAQSLLSPKNARQNEQMLSWWEQERDVRVQELSNAIRKEAGELQALIEKLGEDVHKARFPQSRRKIAGIF